MEKMVTSEPDKPHPEQGQIGKDFRKENEVARFVSRTFGKYFRVDRLDK